jgi:hypothetical protein
MTIRCLFLLLAAFVVVACSDDNGSQLAPEVTAEQILERSRAAYRNATSYQDSGAVETVYISGSQERTGMTRFETAYVAPRAFRFESRMNDFGGEDVVYRIGQDERGIEVWFSSNPEMVQAIDSLQEAIDTGAGVSRDTTGMIAGILFPGSRLGGDIVELTDPKRLGDESIDGVRCFKLQGFRWPNSGRPTTLWVDTEHYLIRQVYEEQNLGDLKTRTTWSYQAVINQPVDAEALRFEQ